MPALAHWRARPDPACGQTFQIVARPVARPSLVMSSSLFGTEQENIFLNSGIYVAFCTFFSEIAAHQNCGQANRHNNVVITFTLCHDLHPWLEL